MRDRIQSWARKLGKAALRQTQGRPWWQLGWWAGGIVLVLSVFGLSMLAPDSCLTIFVWGLLILWMVPSTFALMLWVWRKLTYRIGVRLLISYFLIGVVPFPLLLVLAGIGGYILLGQYASAEFGDVAAAFGGDLARLTEEALVAAEDGGAEAAVEVLKSKSALRGELARASPEVQWLFGQDGRTWRSDNAGPLELPGWIVDGSDSGVFLTADGPVMAAFTRGAGRTAAALLRLGPETAEIWSAGTWYRVSFSVNEIEVSDDGIHISGSEGDRVPPRSGTSGEEEESAPPSAGASSTAAPSTDVVAPERPVGEGWLERAWQSRWIYFFRPSPELERWEDGSPIENQTVTALLKTSPQEVSADLFRSPYKIGRALGGAFLGIALFFLVIYLGVVFLAGLQIFAITRSTARLTHGTRKVQAGDLDYRIPVKRQDQLGDLAGAFNHMTRSVKGMLAEVEEKERLKHELELAREIQQSLLPERHLEHDAISVHAFFRPAAEVGGDYFDLFPLDRGRLIVAAGDVAGHGLSTGLLMAMVKSAVATLVQEGHRGGELLERLNRFMLQQPREHRMVTLAVAEIDLEAGFAEITNAAHPPVFLSGDTVREVMLPALPVGFPWPRPPASERLELEPGSRLVFYSDGLVEAVNDSDDQLGYERLKDFLAEHRELPSEELIPALLQALERHTGGRPLDDDLTVLIIDCGA